MRSGKKNGPGKIAAGGSTRRVLRSGLFLASAVFFLALAVRGYRLAEIQPHHDEFPIFGFNRGDRLEFPSPPDLFLHTLSRNALNISEGATPPVACALAELFRLVFGENLVAARWFHAVIQSLGIALIAWLAWRIYRPALSPALAVAGLGIFSLVSVTYGQFGEMYAIYFFVSVIQCLAYWLILRRGYTRYCYLVFAVIAFACSLFEYQQVWLTLGLLLSSVLESGGPRRWIKLGRALAAALVYGLFSLLPLLDLFGRAPVGTWTARIYFRSYYPDQAAGEGLVRIVAGRACFYLARAYDLVNYHVSLVFDRQWYEPFRWNWFSLPFLLVAAAAVWVSLRRRAVRRSGSGVLPALGSLLAIAVAGNFVKLLPLGGHRNSLFFAPLIWLAYGEAAARLVAFFSRARYRALVSGLLVGLTALPFLYSFPGFYRDRVSRVDLAVLESLIAAENPDTLVLPEASYWPFLMILQRHPDFRKRCLEDRGIELTSFFELADERFGHYPLPFPGEKVLAIDFYQSADGRGEGPGVTEHHPNLRELAGPDWRMKTLLERPGKHSPIIHHQSIFYPPNSLYCYRLFRPKF